MSPGIDPARLGAAAAVVVAYAALCGAVVAGEWRKRRAAAQEARALAGHGGAPLLVVHASQTGAAERLAWQTARALHGAGVPLRVAALETLAPDDLARAERALFIASTSGEGDAPDGANAFVRRHMAPAAGGPSLAGLHYAVLALGDRNFARFCAFGRTLDDWLAGHGAQPLFERIEVDALAAESLERWQHALGRVCSVDVAGDFAPEATRSWRLVARTRTNPGSQGEPVHLLDFEPADGAALPAWESGDLAQVVVPGAARPREYSIASMPAQGRLQLLVRLARHPDGTPGSGSGWLTAGLEVGGEASMRLLPHTAFRLGGNARRPLILVGNGTGIAGLRSHLQALSTAGAPGRHWLVFGEREAARDFHFRADVQAWQADGTLARVDLAFSRDQAERVYVQQRLRESAAEVRKWVGEGAAIYVCGSLAGMASGVEEALVEALGREALDGLIETGRYKRDVY